MAYLIEQAGGTALTCKLERIMDIEIHALHQTSSIVMGSRDMVKDMKEFVEKYGAVIQ
jgi:fructose-1,6-bisphosphatase